MAHHFSCLSRSKTTLVGVVNWVSTNLYFSPQKSTFKQLRQSRQKSIIQPWSKSKSVNSANQGLGTFPTLCASESAIRVITKMFFFFDLYYSTTSYNHKVCWPQGRRTRYWQHSMLCMSLVVRWLQTLVKHELRQDTTSKTEVLPNKTGQQKLCTEC